MDGYKQKQNFLVLIKLHIIFLSKNNLLTIFASYIV